MSSTSIVVAGASGYVGRALLEQLKVAQPGAALYALSRSEQAIEGVRSLACDLFSRRSLEAALPERVDVAYYLVHSMGPTAALDQGSFADYDLLLAHRFATAVKARGVRRVVYLGGLLPSTAGDGPAKLSLHLDSRREVEEVFRGHGLGVVVFRAGLILGDRGSSFQILLKLVARLPIMVCPAWTQTPTTPIDLDSVIEALAASASEAVAPGTYDLAGCLPLTYLEMMQQTARAMGLRRAFLKVPFFTPTLSRLWVSLITRTPKTLVYPLVESLEHPMEARSDHAWPLHAELRQRPYASLLKRAQLKTYPRGTLFRFRPREQTVRSVQRLPGRPAAEIAAFYWQWLARTFRLWLRVDAAGDSRRLSLRGLGERGLLLELKQLPQVDPSAQSFAIVGGLLKASDGDRGRFEFITVPGTGVSLAAIHEFKPALPWFVYLMTQARLHLWVMQGFSRAMERVGRGQPD